MMAPALIRRSALDDFAHLDIDLKDFSHIGFSLEQMSVVDEEIFVFDVLFQGPSSWVDFASLLLEVIDPFSSFGKSLSICEQIELTDVTHAVRVRITLFKGVFWDRLVSQLVWAACTHLPNYYRQY